jgi:glyoxylase I family protein
MEILGVHHIAIIAGNYERSKKFYTEILGFTIEHEYFRPERNSFKCDLSLNGIYTIELFSFPNPPQRLTNPEATGLRHVAFKVNNLDEAILFLHQKGVPAESVRLDEYTGKRFTFFKDPDHLPIEIYEDAQL